jgi:hypothetical protein
VLADKPNMIGLEEPRRKMGLTLLESTQMSAFLVRKLSKAFFNSQADDDRIGWFHFFAKFSQFSSYRHPVNNFAAPVPEAHDDQQISYAPQNAIYSLAQKF